MNDQTAAPSHSGTVIVGVTHCPHCAYALCDQTHDGCPKCELHDVSDCAHKSDMVIATVEHPTSGETFAVIIAHMPDGPGGSPRH